MPDSRAHSSSRTDRTVRAASHPPPTSPALPAPVAAVTDPRHADPMSPSTTSRRPGGPSMLYPELFQSLERARWSLADDVPWDGPPGRARRRAGAHRPHERDHRVVGAARDRDVPARQPARQRLLRLHVDLVLRGAEARPRAHRVPPPGAPRARPDRGGAARGPVRVRPGAAARDAHAALLRRAAAHPVVPPGGGVAPGARAAPPLRAHLGGRGAARRRLPQVHAARARPLRRRRRAQRSRRSASSWRAAAGAGSRSTRRTST